MQDTNDFASFGMQFVMELFGTENDILSYLGYNRELNPMKYAMDAGKDFDDEEFDWDT